MRSTRLVEENEIEKKLIWPKQRRDSHERSEKQKTKGSEENLAEQQRQEIEEKQVVVLLLMEQYDCNASRQKE